MKALWDTNYNEVDCPRETSIDITCSQFQAHISGSRDEDKR